MEKRISSRAIIIEDDFIYLMFRRRILEDGCIKEYYVIPGGGINEGETLQENVKREIREEFSVEVNVLEYLGKDETENSIANFFLCNIISGIPQLGGEELEKCTENNYYEIRKVKISNLDSIDVLGKDMILKAYNDLYVMKLK